MNNMSNERLKQHIDNPLDNGLSRAEVMEVIRELLALREAGKEPVAYADLQSFDNFKSMGGKNAACTKEWMWRDPSDDLVPLYAAPQLPAVPDEREAFESFMIERFGESIDRRRAKNGDNEYMAWDMAVAWTVWQHRASMIAAAPKPE